MINGRITQICICSLTARKNCLSIYVLFKLHLQRARWCYQRYKTRTFLLSHSEAQKFPYYRELAGAVSFKSSTQREKVKILIRTWKLPSYREVGASEMDIATREVSVQFPGKGLYLSAFDGHLHFSARHRSTVDAYIYFANN